MILVLVVINSAQDVNVKVRNGALVQRRGMVKLVNNIVIVKKNISEIKILNEKTKEMENSLTNILKRESDKETIQIIEGFKESLSGLTRSRKKRSLLPFVGKLLNGLFGVATESDLQKEKERLDRIEGWAKEYGHVIDKIVDNMNQHVIAISNISATLKEIEEKVETEINKIERKLIIQELALKMNNMKDEIKEKFEGFILAQHGIATNYLITPKEVEEIIKYSIINFAFNPLEIDLLTYYHLITVKIVHDTCFILLPFNSNTEMLMYKIIPFPMMIEKKGLILKDKTQIVLENKENSMISIWKEKDVEQCVIIKEQNYICNHPDFYLQPSSNFPCIRFLLNNGEDQCNYDEFYNMFHVAILKDIYVYTKEPQSAIVECSKGKEKRISIENVHVFPKSCHVKIIDYFFYKPSIFQHVKLNETFEEVVFKLNVSNFKLPKFNVRVNQIQGMTNNILFLYKEKVMPYMTMLLIPLIFVIAIVIFFIVKKVLIDKVNEIKKTLNRIEGK